MHIPNLQHQNFKIYKESRNETGPQQLKPLSPDNPKTYSLNLKETIPKP